MVSNCDNRLVAVGPDARTDYVGSRLAEGTKFGAVPDAGFFLDTENVYGVRDYTDRIQTIANLSQAVGDAGCMAAHADAPWRCMMAEYTFPFISTPLHMIQSSYDSWQLDNVLQLPCYPPTATKHCNATAGAPFQVQLPPPPPPPRKRTRARKVSGRLAFLCGALTLAVHGYRAFTQPCYNTWRPPVSSAARVSPCGAMPAWLTRRQAAWTFAWPGPETLRPESTCARPLSGVLWQLLQQFRLARGHENRTQACGERRCLVSILGEWLAQQHSSGSCGPVRVAMQHPLLQRKLRLCLRQENRPSTGLTLSGLERPGGVAESKLMTNPSPPSPPLPFRSHSDAADATLDFGMETGIENRGSYMSGSLWHTFSMASVPVASRCLGRTEGLPAMLPSLSGWIGAALRTAAATAGCSTVPRHGPGPSSVAFGGRAQTHTPASRY
jgi:hypothetical protein